MRKKRITRIRIPLEDLQENERNRLKNIKAQYTIVFAKDPCLTCGHRTRVQSIQRTDGKRELIQECLYCMIKNPTDSNKGAP